MQYLGIAATATSTAITPNENSSSNKSKPKRKKTKPSSYNLLDYADEDYARIEVIAQLFALVIFCSI